MLKLKTAIQQLSTTKFKIPNIKPISQINCHDEKSIDGAAQMN